jgi:RHH-type proline utilization regulon transcriptional repressor/proline dehydrogenase/delta 1-pyrroline-5-carboxylate dehydrogenase
MSAFRSAGQRCSALRLLCVQEDVADSLLTMIKGAVDTLKLGNPEMISTHIGPVIDQEAKDRIISQIEGIKQRGRLLYQGEAPRHGTFVAPHLVEIDAVSHAKEEVFGPVLQIVRFKADGLDQVLADLAGLGYGLTLGVHSRIDSTIEKVTHALPIGNCYINRNMIGAVVGTQPFGGCGLSGTGPKAGGPHYLMRFVTEQTVTINTAAAGGNADLMATGD